jgi:hypothetical protein
VNTIIDKTSNKSAKVAEKGATKAPHRAKSARRGPGKRVATKAAKPRKAVAKSSARDAPVQAYIAAMTPGRELSTTYGRAFGPARNLLDQLAACNFARLPGT